MIAVSGSSLTPCTEIKRYPDGRETRFACELVDLQPGAGLLRFVLPKPVRLAGVLVPAGTVSYGCFWTDRTYNLYLMVAPADGQVRVGYFNACQSVELAWHQFRWTDLWIDVVYLPEQPPQILDEAEVPSGDPRRPVIAGTTAYLINHGREVMREAEEWIERRRNVPTTQGP